MHATAIFGLAEAASGFALAGAFAPVVLEIRPVAGTASIRYLKIAKTDLVAHAAVLGEPPALRAELAQRASVAFVVEVVVREAAGAEIARASVEWIVKSKGAGKATAAA